MGVNSLPKTVTRYNNILNRLTFAEVTGKISDRVIRPIHFCRRRCRTRRISKITCVLRTETVTDCCCVNRQVDVSLLSTNIKQFRLTDRQTDAISD